MLHEIAFYAGASLFCGFPLIIALVLIVIGRSWTAVWTKTPKRGGTRGEMPSDPHLLLSLHWVRRT